MHGMRLLIARLPGRRRDLVDSPGGANRQQWGFFSLQQRLFAGGGAPTYPDADAEHMADNCSRSLTRSVIHAYGRMRQVTVGATPGANGCDGVIILAGTGGTSIFNGFLVELLGYSTGGQAAAVRGISCGQIWHYSAIGDDDGTCFRTFGCIQRVDIGAGGPQIRYLSPGGLFRIN